MCTPTSWKEIFCCNLYMNNNMNNLKVTSSFIGNPPSAVWMGCILNVSIEFSELSVFPTLMKVNSHTHKDHWLKIIFKSNILRIHTPEVFDLLFLWLMARGESLDLHSSPPHSSWQCLFPAWFCRGRVTCSFPDWHIKGNDVLQVHCSRLSSLVGHVASWATWWTSGCRYFELNALSGIESLKSKVNILWMKKVNECC